MASSPSFFSSGVILLFLSLSSSIVASFSPPQTPPVLSNTFLDPHVVVQIPPPFSIFNYNSSIYQYEDPVSGDIYSLQNSISYPYSYPLNITLISVPQTNSSDAYIVQNGICRLTPVAEGSFTIPPFSSLQSSVFIGLENLTQPAQNNRTVECQLWCFNETLIFYLETTPPFNLVKLLVNSTDAAISVDFSPLFTFDPSYLSPPPSSLFDVPLTCHSNYVCEEGPVVPIEVYNWHTANDFFLNNTNVADLSEWEEYKTLSFFPPPLPLPLLHFRYVPSTVTYHHHTPHTLLPSPFIFSYLTVGDAFFICSASSIQLFNYFQWISQWQVLVNSTWGQYQLCNFGECFGGDTHLVGRETGVDLNAEFGGQCVSNSPLGSWYSLPGASECSPEQSIGDSDCTWKVLLLGKTINASCLFSDSGFLKTCASELPTGNFTLSAQIFAKAFLSDDPNQGGCPPIAIDAINPNKGSGNGNGSGSGSGSERDRTSSAMTSARTRVFRALNELVDSLITNNN